MKKSEELVIEAIKNKIFPGCQYAIITQNDIIFKCFGYKQLIPNEEKAEITTLYDLASLSKAVTTNYMLSYLLTKKKLKLSDKVSDILPRFKHKKITIFDLAIHSSGLPADIDFNKCKIKIDVLDAIYNLDLEYEPGSTMVYSDCGYILLGEIIEKITNKSLDEYCNEIMIKPLGLKYTTYNPSDKKNCAATEVTTDRGTIKGEAHDEKCFLMGGIAGHAGLFSNVLDLSIYAKNILDDNLPFEKEIVDFWFTPYVQNTKGEKRGIGWIAGLYDKSTGNYASENTISHRGFTGTNMIIDRDNQLGIIFLSNRIHPTRTTKGIMEFRINFANAIYEEMILNRNSNQQR